jgi:hypothetical protein
VPLELTSFVSTVLEPRVYVSEKIIAPDLFRSLVESFPTEHLNEKMGEAYFAEIDSERHGNEFRQIMHTRSEWNKLFRFVTSSKFRSQLLQRFSTELHDLRGTEMMTGLRSSDTEVKCSFHMSRNGYLLSPHTDTGKKMITIVIYVGEFNEELIGAGTRFYRARSQKLGSEYLQELLDDDDRKELEKPNGIVGVNIGRVYSAGDRTLELQEHLKRFDSIHDCVFECGFRGNRAVLFIKSNTSWHDVRLESVSNGQFRRTFVVNFSLTQSRRSKILRSLIRA